MTTEHCILIGMMLILIVVVPLFCYYCFNPYKFPYFKHTFDVSGKRLPQMEDYIDRFLCSGGMILIEEHKSKIEKWQKDCEADFTNRRIWKRHRENQYQKTLDLSHAYQFVFVRKQTRYRQQNYVKTPYTVQQINSVARRDYTWLLDRALQLEALGGECTLKEYHARDQRKLMTPGLRRKIMERDNYTCQICGKYMPDEVGLHIDHIVPVSKGGKSIPSNLQVLCSKCNGSKSNKVK